MSSTQMSLSWCVDAFKVTRMKVRTCCMTDLEGERRDGLPHVEGLSNRPLGVLLAHFRREVGNTARNKKENLTNSSVILNHTHTHNHRTLGGQHQVGCTQTGPINTNSQEPNGVMFCVSKTKAFSVVFRRQWLSVLRLEWLQHEELLWKTPDGSVSQSQVMNYYNYCLEATCSGPMLADAGEAPADVWIFIHYYVFSVFLSVCKKKNAKSNTWFLWTFYPRSHDNVLDWSRSVILLDKQQRVLTVRGPCNLKLHFSTVLK